MELVGPILLVTALVLLLVLRPRDGREIKSTSVAVATAGGISLLVLVGTVKSLNVTFG